MAAWIGLVPRQYSTGGRTRLGGVGRRANHYLRRQLVHGARAVALRLKTKNDARSLWFQAVIDRRNDRANAWQSHQTTADRILSANVVEPFVDAFDPFLHHLEFCDERFKGLMRHFGKLSFAKSGADPRQKQRCALRENQPIFGEQTAEVVDQTGALKCGFISRTCRPSSMNRRPQ